MCNEQTCEMFHGLVLFVGNETYMVKMGAVLPVSVRSCKAGGQCMISAVPKKQHNNLDC